MSYDRIREATLRTVGTKQTLKAVEKDQVREVFIARNADERITAPLVRLCRGRNVNIIWVDDIIELGKACAIEVGTASAAILVGNE